MCMGVVRWGPGSQIYLYQGPFGWECAGCLLSQRGTTKMAMTQIETRLNDHIAAGHRVPQSAFERLKIEMQIGDK